MKKSLQALLLPVIIFMSGCQKESTTGNSESTPSSVSKSILANGCQMTVYDYYDVGAEYHAIDNFSYANGKVSAVEPSYGLRYEIEYDAQNKLAHAKVYSGTDFLYTMDFIYQNNKVVREVWRVQNTDVVDDENILTYDQQGRIIHNQSVLYGYETDFEYYTNGSLKKWSSYNFGVLSLVAEYTYKDQYKNPFATLTGLPYSFWYTNSAFGRGIGEKWYSSEKLTYYDLNGVGEVYYANDPTKTEFLAGPQNLPVSANYFETNDDGSVILNFSYGNCNQGQNSKIAMKKSAGNLKGINGTKFNTLQQVFKKRN